MNWEIELDTEDHETLATKEISEAFDEWGFACGLSALMQALLELHSDWQSTRQHGKLIYTLLEVASAISLAHGGESDLASVDFEIPLFMFEDGVRAGREKAAVVKRLMEIHGCTAVFLGAANWAALEEHSLAEQPTDEPFSRSEVVACLLRARKWASSDDPSSIAINGLFVAQD